MVFLLRNERKTEVTNTPKPTHNLSLQKSCLLADAPPKIDTFEFLK